MLREPGRAPCLLIILYIRILILILMLTTSKPPRAPHPCEIVNARALTHYRTV
jgi:hypothetical protein